MLKLVVLAALTSACVKLTGTATSVELRRRELNRAISPKRLVPSSASPLSTRAHSAFGIVLVSVPLKRTRWLELHAGGKRAFRGLAHMRVYC